jgi:hypothetical protein
MIIHTCFKSFILNVLFLCCVSSLYFKSRLGCYICCTARWWLAVGLVLLQGCRCGSRADVGARFQMLARNASEREARDAMRAGIGCRRGAPSGQTLPSERELHPDGHRDLDARALVVPGNQGRQSKGGDRTSRQPWSASSSTAMSSQGSPRARLRSWAATFRVCDVGPRGGLALGSQNYPLCLAL